MVIDNNPVVFCAWSYMTWGRKIFKWNVTNRIKNLRK